MLHWRWSVCGSAGGDSSEHHGNGGRPKVLRQPVQRKRLQVTGSILKKLVFVSPRWVNNCLVFCPAGDRWTGTATWTWTGSGCVLDPLKRFVTASTYNWGFQKYGSQFLPVEWKITEWGTLSVFWLIGRMSHKHHDYGTLCQDVEDLSSYSETGSEYWEHFIILKQFLWYQVKIQRKKDIPKVFVWY